MHTPRLSSTQMFLALTLALPSAFACSGSSGDGDGGSTDSAMARQMSQLGDLGDEFVGENQEAYDGVKHAAEHIASTFSAAAGAPATLGAKAEGCLPPELEGVTHEFDSQQGVFTPTDVPGAPADVARFNIYGTDNGVANDQVIGTLDISCVGVFPNLQSVNIKVIVDGVVLLDLLASNPFFGFGSFSSQLSGFLSNADGTDQIQFGLLGRSWVDIYEDEFSSYVNRSIDFDLGDNVFGHVEHSVSQDTSFGGSEWGLINVREDTFIYDPMMPAACPGLDFRVDLQNVGSGLSGPAVFCAPPPVADGYNYFVGCYEGTMENMSVSAASSECLTSFYELDPTPVGQSTIDQMQRGTDGLLGMANAVFGVVEAGAEFADALATQAAQQL